MSKSEQKEHGTITSYVIGFILSLIFTIIPYHMVVNKTVTGTALLLSILGFAFIQMIIQITFFLHIGRGPKPKWNLFFFVSTASIILVVVGGSIVIIHNLHYNMKPSDQVIRLVNDEGISQIDGIPTGACSGQRRNYQIIIEGNLISPNQTYANRCDTLTFVVKDSRARNIVFGQYPKTLVYAGESKLVVQKYHNQTITLSQTGSFNFYDSHQPSVAGVFTVAQ